VPSLVAATALRLLRNFFTWWAAAGFSKAGARYIQCMLYINRNQAYLESRILSSDFKLQLRLRHEKKKSKIYFFFKLFFPFFLLFQLGKSPPDRK
jgi:hypothetical protein